MQEALATPVADPVVEWEVLARFRSPAAMNEAIKHLEVSGFGRESIGLPEIDPPPERATPEVGSQAADTGADVQQSRVFYAAVGGAVAAMIGALVAAVSGGGMGAIAGAAIGAGIVVGGIAHLISRAFSNATQRRREDQAAHGKLMLAVRTDSAERHERASAVLRENGGEVL